MPRLEETEEQLLGAGRKLRSSTARFMSGFLDFVFDDNVLEVAVGLIIAAAFTTVVKSFVSDIMTPMLSLIPAIDRNFDQKFAVLSRGPNYKKLHGYNTVKLAQEDGAVVMTYGTFLNELFNLLGIGFALYSLAITYGWAAKDNIIKHQVKCKYCRKRISEKARRCFACTSWQDGREDET